MATLNKLDDAVLKLLKPREKRSELPAEIAELFQHAIDNNLNSALSESDLVRDKYGRITHTIERQGYNKHIGGGLYAYVYPNGRVVCRYQYQMDGKRRKLALGEYVAGKGRAAVIFKEYQVAHAMRTVQTIDPVAEKEKLKAAEALEAEAEAKSIADKKAQKLADDNRATVAMLAVDFMENYKGKVPTRGIADSTMRVYSATIDKHVIPNFGQYPLDELPEDEILDFIADKRSNQLHAVMSAMFLWATKQRRYNNPNTGARRFRRNPLAGVSRPAANVIRDRVLDFGVRHGKFQNKGEIKAFWEWLDTISNPNHGDALRLLLMTGLRSSEALGLQWEDVFADEITIPADKMKSQHGVHTVPFTPQLKALVDDIRSRAKKAGDKDYLFPRRVGKQTESGYPHLGHPALSGLILRAIRAGDLKIDKFSPHDLRRSCATHVRSLGFNISDVNALLHHKEAGVIQHYDFADPIEKKLAMLTAWHNRLDELIHGQAQSNVVDIMASQ